MSRIIKHEGTAMDAPQLKSKLKSFARGEMTWAEVEA